jgi:hypothetical protein
MGRLTGIFSFFFMIVLGVYGQKQPIKFGQVSMEELQMTAYPGDTSASAVILCDYGHFRSTTFQFTRILRIKILNKDGYIWANNVFPTSEKAMIKGITFNIENGNIVQSKLKNESIFTERVTEQSYRTRVAMPDVREGSVIDIMFTFPGIPFIWKFQERIPEKYNELIIEPSPNIRFSKNFYGFVPLNISSETRWVAKEVPAFKNEPFLNSEENYITKLEFDILDVHFESFNQSFTSSWEAISKSLMVYDYFGKAMYSAVYLNSLAKKIEESGKTRKEKMVMAYETIKNEVKWDEKISLSTSTPALSYVYKMKLGNSADINLMLIQLLRKLDIDVIPVVLSTRDNGIVSPVSPSLQKLNYVIARARIDGNTYLLDATEPFMPHDLLPLRSLNYMGHSVDEDKSEPVVIQTTKKDKKIVLYNLSLRENRTLAGKMTVVNSDYAAYDFRKKFSTFNGQDEFIEDYQKNRPGLSVIEASFNNRDSLTLPVTENYEIAIGSKLSGDVNEIYINPAFFDQMTENPFKTDERKYPIDFGYRIEKTVISTITIPNNFTVNTLPTPVNIKLQGNDASFQMEVVNDGSIVKVSSKFMINKALFLQEDCNTLKEFYNQIIKKQAEPVSFKKL